MKKALIALGLLAFLGTPSWGAGGLGATVSYWDGDESGDDNGLGLKLEFGFGEHIDLELRGAYLDGFEAVKAGRLFQLEATPLDFGLAYNFAREAVVNPYLGGGASYVLFEVDVVGPVAGEGGRVEDEFGWYAVAGIEIGASRHLGFFLEGLYRSVKANVEGNGVFSFDNVSLDFTGPAANLGVLFSW